ncbi:hypothetical protein DPMN_145450 [Dreissena polymorpha]|uniref:Uncharacterized protein n=1 Tax=Dreissena polymorpha TaxID=45954 RepID=A0A9D4IXI5_DREPO|nr:hypothetical protein DPMN_145450 [Dreissena polymorpha]
MEPGFKPVSYHLPSKGRIPVATLSLRLCTDSNGFTQGLEPKSRRLHTILSTRLLSDRLPK